MSNEKLSRLHTALVDARAGYKTAIEDAETAEIKALLQQVDAVHAAAHADIDKALLAHGEKPDEDGSYMSTVHRTVISVRAALTGIDENTLSSFASGEERIADLYDDAIEHEADPATADMLGYHKSRLAGMITRMKKVAA